MLLIFIKKNEKYHGSTLVNLLESIETKIVKGRSGNANNTNKNTVVDVVVPWDAC